MSKNIRCADGCGWSLKIELTSATVEDPSVVLISPAAGEFSHGWKPAPAVEQLVREGNIHLTMGELNEPSADDRLSVPMKARHDRCVLLRRADFASIRQQLVFDLPGTAVADKLGL